MFPRKVEGAWVAVYSAVSCSPAMTRIEFVQVNDLVRTGPEYTNGQERLAIARSTDGGWTWERDSRNPLPVMPPEKVVSFRQPLIGAYHFR